MIGGLVCLAACSSPKNETADVGDSTKVDSVHATSAASASDASTFDVDPSIESNDLTLFGKKESIVYWMKKIYSPDQLVNRKTDTLSGPLYVIKSVELIDNKYTDANGKCVSQPILLVLRNVVMSGEEYFDVHFISDSENILMQKETFDGSMGQSTGSVSLSDDYKLSENCPALTVTESYDGGDIGRVITKGISFFIASEGGMKRVLDLTLEETQEEFRSSAEEEEKSTSEIRDFEILSKKTNGLFDVKVHTTNKKNKEVTEESNSVFRFDGEKYIEQKN
jgi:hypothetical protein